MKKKAQECLYQSEKKLVEAKQELEYRTEETEMAKSLFQRTENQKKLLADRIKDLEVENVNYRSTMLKSDMQIQVLNYKIQNLTEVLAQSEEKLNSYDAAVEQLEEATEKIKALELKFYDEAENSHTLNHSLESVKYSLDIQKRYWLKKEIAYQASIQELLEQLNNEKIQKEVKIAESIKLKKALTIKETDETIAGYSKEELIRYHKRTNSLEKTVVQNKIEIEKLLNNQEYYRALVKSKNEIISKLEFQVEGLEAVQKELKSDEKVENQSLKDAIVYLRSSLLCQNCVNSKSISLISPCGHVICSLCKPDNAMCCVCNKPYTYCSPCSYLEVLETLCNQLELLIH